ncbi:MAG: UDP-glucose 4-epimerase GalE [Alphaproteobacteria bacterium]|nr:UDP-glucose 4-epimerase GalE [Alphaproteobacteria bacterium]
MANVLVTGGAGFVGAHVCKALARAGHRPIAFDNLSRGQRTAVKSGPLEVSDVLDRAALTDALRRHKIEAVMHLAGLTVVHESVAEPARYYVNNVAGTIDVLAAMADAQVKSIVLSSSCTVYDDQASGALNEAASLAPASPYALSKLMIEGVTADAAAAHGFSWLALRYFNAAGADPDGELSEADVLKVRLIPNLLRAAARGGAPFRIQGDDYPTRDGTCIRDLVHVSDLAAAHVAALDRIASLPKVINLGSGRGYSVRETLDAVARVTGKSIATEVAPRRPGDVAVRIADATLATTALGWSPRRASIDDIVADAWASRRWDND